LYCNVTANLPLFNSLSKSSSFWLYSSWVIFLVSNSCLASNFCFSISNSACLITLSLVFNSWSTSAFNKANLSSVAFLVILATSSEAPPLAWITLVLSLISLLITFIFFSLSVLMSLISSCIPNTFCSCRFKLLSINALSLSVMFCFFNSLSLFSLSFFNLACSLDKSSVNVISSSKFSA
jgi:hypothetical protein